MAQLVRSFISRTLQKPVCSCLAEEDRKSLGSAALGRVRDSHKMRKRRHLRKIPEVSERMASMCKYKYAHMHTYA